MGPAAGLLLAVVIYCVQLAWSRWWFTRYEFGPMEWLWRALTYGGAPAMAQAVVKTPGPESA